MSALKQKTIQKPIELNGVGLHSGDNVSLVINPAEPNTGIIFKRTDLKNNNLVIPSVFNVVSAVLCTTISNDSGVKVSTIEHLMGALFGMGVDNALIEINNEEVPILDGSGIMYVNKIKEVGLKISEVPIKIIKIEKKISYEEGSKSISFEPSNISLDIDFEIKYENALIGTQRNLVKVYEDDLSEIYNSRTFCLFEDVEKLRSRNLAKGGSLDNAVVVQNDRILNKDGLRNKKEFVNHKILDCIGDLYLAGYKIIGKLTCSQGGHRITNQLLRNVFEDNTNFSIMEINEKNVPHSLINKNILKSIA
ncbi:UDP-3-O-acyl-N-acetylglucosamine deacetylase [Pelagibacteraceae bacterium]|jgi:UDP-3-O-[3-hydroxymyristoyl] N-acetylglucosamine deacetylase|nr:UDP-3-O-acyl-N-acetylglucosamine deacetylase [Pelagibacteraceae bacterium]